MMLASPTHYDSLPPMPTISALPGGVPMGPYGPLYRAAPGAQIPAVRYPGMMGAPPVQLVGGLGNSTGKKMVVVGISALGAAGLGAAMGLAVHNKKRPVLYPALLLGGVSLASSLILLALSE